MNKMKRSAVVPPDKLLDVFFNEECSLSSSNEDDEQQVEYFADIKTTPDASTPVISLLASLTC